MTFEKIGITGANGFIGSHLLRALVRQGRRPIAFLQKGSSLEPIEDLEGKHEAVFGDLLDPASLEGFVSRCDAIVHLAGLNRYWVQDRTLFEKINLQSVRTLAELCLKHGVKKLVHASSCITRGASDDPADLRNESSDYNLGVLRFPYGETKSAGEEEIKRFVRERNLPAVIINPTSAIGERDYAPTPIGKPIADIARGMWPVYVAGGACFIDVHDVVRGFLLALERAKPGSQYLLVGENLTNREFMTMVAECAGVKAPRVKIPHPVIKVIGHAAETISDVVTKKDPPLTRAMTGLIGRYLYFDGTRAKEDLGFQAGPCRPAIERCIQWFRQMQ